MLVDLYQKNRNAFDRYQSLLLKWNEKINLTAITDPIEVVERHFLDSLALLPAMERWLADENVSRETFSKNLSLLDIGAGGGFPGIPLKIVRPEWRVKLADSVKKKCDFMKEVVRALGLTNIEVTHQTLEKGESEEKFDLVLSRSSFSLGEFLQLGCPRIQQHGLLVAYKGGEVEAEIKEAELLLGPLHLRPFDRYVYELPSSKVRHQLVMTHFL